MIDTLVRLLARAADRWPRLQKKHALERYALVTLHRPSNVDDPQALGALLAALGRVGRELPLLFPVHPRTRKRLAADGLRVPPRVHLLEPQGYLDFLALQSHASVVITDSGGIQEETTYLGIPCLTLRENTERPVTVTVGTNLLIGRDPDRLQVEVERILSGQGKRGRRPPLWDGHAAERIASVLMDGAN
jgi:UDP-N-acetylglucosamine 2-epimerase (non-hydrolysing)